MFQLGSKTKHIKNFTYSYFQRQSFTNLKQRNIFTKQRNNLLKQSLRKIKQRDISQKESLFLLMYYCNSPQKKLNKQDREYLPLYTKVYVVGYSLCLNTVYTVN